MSTKATKNKSKSATKPNKIKLPVQNNQISQLPYYLCNQPPIFLSQQKSLSPTYFPSHSQLTQQDIPKCQHLLTQFTLSQKQTQQRISQLTQFTSDNCTNFNSSLPFYSCKNIIFNEYLICLKFYQLFRLNNVDFTTGSGLRLYRRLVYLKTLVLKLGGIEKKIQYQKNKLLRMGEKVRIKEFKSRQNGQKDQQQKLESQSVQNQEEGQQNQQNQDQNQQGQRPQEEDNLMFKPMVKSLIANKISNKKQQKKDEKYVAPKQSSVLPADEKRKRREQRQAQRRKAFLLRKFRGDIEQIDQAEQKNMLQGIDQKFKRKYEQKQRFQQQNFTRLNQTKKQKYFKKQMMKNRFNNNLNDQLNEISLIRQLVAEQSHKNKDKDKNRRPTISPSAKGQKPQKKRKVE